MKLRVVSDYFLTATTVSAIMIAVAVTSASAQNIYEANWYPPGEIDSITPGGTLSSFESNLGYQPEGLAFDSSGNLYVATSGSTIDKITPGGTMSVFASGFSNASSIAFNGSGDLFMADHNTGDIYEISPAGVLLSTFATGLAIDGPGALAFDSAGNLFVANNGTGSIYKYTPGGARTTFASGFFNANAIAFNAAGTLFLGDNTNIVEFPGGVQTTFATGLGNSLQALAFDSSGNLFVTQGASGPLVKITPGGTVSTFSPDFGNATGLAIGPVPEPSTIALSLLGSTAVLLRRLRKTSDR